MKKVISSIAVCSLAVCALASCGSKKSEKAAESADITGKWSIDSLEDDTLQNGGIIFQDGKGSVYTDSSKILHFNDEGLELGNGESDSTIISKDYFKEEGKKLTVDLSGMELLVMTKLDDTEGYDGTYSLEGGLLYEELSAEMSDGAEEKPESVDISLKFDGESSEMLFNDLFNYEIKDGKLSFSGYSAIMGITSDDGPYDYKIDGDKLSITSQKKTETFTRVK